MKNNSKLRILNVVGARPNFIKIAPLMTEYKKHPEIEALLVHTGQHYSDKMSNLFFDQLEIPKPDIYLGVGSATHAVQTAEIMKRFEPVALEYRPDILLVVGDVNSTLAGALAAVKMGIKIAHVEAGLRSFDRQMPEEINRVITDTIADYLFVTEASGLKNLKEEGITEEKVFFVGNVMIDTLLRNLKKAKKSTIVEDLGLDDREYALVTLHRPTNVDDASVLERLLEVFGAIGRQLPVIFPAHPRTRKNITASCFQRRTKGRNQRLELSPKDGVSIIDPVGYLDFLKLMASAKVVLTDSGCIQEETTILQVSCLTLRENTERPITIEQGTNILVGIEPSRILAGFKQVMTNSSTKFEIPDLWDGHAAERIVKVLLRNAFK